MRGRIAGMVIEMLIIERFSAIAEDADMSVEVDVRGKAEKSGMLVGVRIEVEKELIEFVDLN